MDPRYTFPTQMAKKSSTGMVVGIIIVLLLIAGGAAYYFLVYKKNKDAEAAAAEQKAPVEEEPVVEKEMGTMEVASGAGGTGTGTGGGAGGTTGASTTQSTGGTAAPTSAPVQATPYSTEYPGTSCWSPAADIGYLGVKSIDEAKAACNNNTSCGAITRHEGGDFWLLSNADTQNPRANSTCWKK